MRVLFVQPYISFSGIVSDNLPGQLARRGHDVIVLTYARDKKKARSLLKEEKVHFDLADAISISIPNLVTEFPYFLFLEKEIKKTQPDIVHINNLAFLTTVQSVMITTRLHGKSIVHVHGVFADRGSLLNFAQKAYIHTIGQFIFSKADKIICLTTDDAITINKWGCPWKKIRIIPNGVDIDRFSPSGDETSNLLLWCGRLVREKGLQYLIEALRIIVKEEEHPETKLVIAGDGPLLPKIQESVRKCDLATNITLMDRVPHREMPALMNKASIHVLPSLKEGMPYVLLEAMACGKPVIGSNISGIKDIITHGKNGILVPPRDPEALANAILTLLGDRNLRRTIGQNARELMTRRYSWDTITARVEKVYEETLAGACCETSR